KITRPNISTTEDTEERRPILGQQGIIPPCPLCPLWWRAYSAMHSNKVLLRAFVLSWLAFVNDDERSNGPSRRSGSLFGLKVIRLSSLDRPWAGLSQRAFSLFKLLLGPIPGSARFRFSRFRHGDRCLSFLDRDLLAA